MALTIISVWSVFLQMSESLPSDEVTVTPVDDMQQQFSESPVVISAETTGSKKFLFFFLRRSHTSTDNPEFAFSITEEEGNQNSIEVQSATYNMASGGEEKSEVLLQTADTLITGTNYRVTVSAQITDTEANPVESGSTDSAVFEGFSGKETTGTYIPMNTEKNNNTETSTPAEEISF